MSLGPSQRATWKVQVVEVGGRYEAVENVGNDSNFFFFISIGNDSLTNSKRTKSLFIEFDYQECI